MGKISKCLKEYPPLAPSKSRHSLAVKQLVEFKAVNVSTFYIKQILITYLWISTFLRDIEYEKIWRKKKPFLKDNSRVYCCICKKKHKPEYDPELIILGSSSLHGVCTDFNILSDFHVSITTICGASVNFLMKVWQAFYKSDKAQTIMVSAGKGEVKYK